LARAGVGIVCSTEKLVGESSLTTVVVPSPCEVMASFVAGLKVAPSHPTPMGRSGDDMAVRSRENDHVVLLAASGEEDVVFGVKSEPGAILHPCWKDRYLPTIFMVLASMTAMADLSSIST